jgi:hypothetical protein
MSYLDQPKRIWPNGRENKSEFFTPSHTVIAPFISCLLYHLLQPVNRPSHRLDDSEPVIFFLVHLQFLATARRASLTPLLISVA